MLPSKQASSRCEITSIPQPTQINPSICSTSKHKVCEVKTVLSLEAVTTQKKSLIPTPFTAKHCDFSPAWRREGHMLDAFCRVWSLAITIYTCVLSVLHLAFSFLGSMMQDLWFYGLFLNGFFSSFVDDQTCYPWQSKACETVTGRAARSM